MTAGRLMMSARRARRNRRIVVMNQWPARIGVLSDGGSGRQAAMLTRP